MSAELATWTEVDRQLRSLARRRAELDAAELPWLRAAEHVKLHLELGYATVLEYLERVMGYTPRVAKDRLRMAHALASLPAMTAALATGQLPASAVRELVRVAVADTEQAWVAAATGRTVREVEELVRGRRRGDRPEDPADPDLALRTLRLEVTPATLALFRQAQQVAELETGERLTDDAFVALMAQAVLAPADRGPEAEARPAHQIATTVCEQCERGWQDGAGAAIEVSPAEIARARCDADDIGSLRAEQPARARSTIPPAVRRLVLRRFHHRCAAPGCRSARHLEVHHIVPLALGGDHDPSSLAPLCSIHHRLHHAGKLRISGRSPDALVFQHEDGRPYGAPRKAASADEQEPAGADPRATLRDAERVLRASGWDQATSRIAVERAATHVGQDASLEVLVRAAFRAAGTINNVGGVRASSPHGQHGARPG